MNWQSILVAVVVLGALLLVFKKCGGGCCGTKSKDSDNKTTKSM